MLWSIGLQVECVNIMTTTLAGRDLNFVGWRPKFGSYSSSCSCQSRIESYCSPYVFSDFSSCVHTVCKLCELISSIRSKDPHSFPEGFVFLNEWMVNHILAFGRHFYPNHSLGIKPRVLVLGFNCCIFPDCAWFFSFCLILLCRNPQFARQFEPAQEPAALK